MTLFAAVLIMVIGYAYALNAATFRQATLGMVIAAAGLALAVYWVADSVTSSLEGMSILMGGSGL